jgi:hypothetical protein
MLGGSILLSALLAVTVFAQGAPKKAAPAQAGAAKAVTWADLTGEWVGNSLLMNKDSVITESATTFTADKKIWIKLPNRDPIAAKLITMGGDSLVIETDTYNSVTRPGHKVSNRMVTHYVNGTSKGTFHATFDDGRTLDGRTVQTKKK